VCGLAKTIVSVTILFAVAACSGTPQRTRTPSPADDGLNVADCLAQPESASTGGSWREVACDDPVAIASATAVESLPGGVAGAMAEPECPAGTDYALRATDFRPVGRDVSWSFVCARNLEPPHPGDPGGGGGPDIVAGDCVHTTANLGTVKEARCDGKGKLKPTHKVTMVATAICPPGNDVSVKVGRAQFGQPLSQKVACAKAL
jgi:hypothetical protein